MGASTFMQRRPHPLEPKVLIQFVKLRNIALFVVDGVEVKRQRHITFHRHQHAACRQPFERLAQILTNHAFDVGRIRHHAIERAIFRNPFRRCFRADFFHPRHVVNGVAHQRQIIDDAVRWHAEFLGDADDAQFFVGHGVVPKHAVFDQLREVFVAGGNDRIHATHHRVLGERADDIVGFHASHFDAGPAERLGDFADMADLMRQIFRHLFAVGFVFRIDVVAKGFATGIEHAGAIIGGVFFAQFVEHVGHTEDGTGGLAARRTKVRHGVKCAVEITGNIDKQQARLGVFAGRMRAHGRQVF